MYQRLASLALLSVACMVPPTAVTGTKAPGQAPGPAPGPAAVKDWTILVYMAADQDDLKPFAYMNLYEMESALDPPSPSAHTDVLVQLDTPGRKGLRRLHIAQSAEPYNSSLTKEYFDGRSEADLRSPIVRVLEEPEKASFADAAQDLKSFLHWGITSYPARHYMVVVWGHGRGFSPAQKIEGGGAATGLRGIAADQTQGTYLDTPLLRDTLQAVVKEDLGGRPLDIYASDACLMQSIEVATELSAVARFVVGSAQIQPFSGLPYRQLLHEINSGRFGLEPTAADLPPPQEDQAYLVARMLPTLAAATLRGDGLQARLSPDAAKTFTLSALRTREVKSNLVPALHEVGRLLGASIDAAPLRAVQLGLRIQRMPSFLGGSTDLGFFLSRMRDTLLTSGWCRMDYAAGEEVVQCSDRPTTALLVALNRAQHALSQSVVSATYGEDYLPTENPARMPGFAAVSVWLPRSERDYQNRIRDFLTATFYQPSTAPGSAAPALTADASPWGGWLAKIFNPAPAK